MHEYELLEKRWKRHKLKKSLQKVLILILLIAVLFSLYRFLPYSKNVHTPHLTSSQPNIILPNFDFEKNLKVPTPQTKVVTKKPPIPPKTPLLSKAKKRVQIQTKGSDIQTLQKAYEYHPSKSLALLIAQKLYNGQNYKKALEWSIKANEFDKTEERSWIIFAKAAYKLGDKRRAIDALRAYLHHHQSPTVQKLYLQMQKGAFQ